MADIVKRLGAPVGTHAVDLHHHETQFGELVRPVHGAESLGDKGSLRPGVNLLQNRVTPGRVETRRLENHTPNIGFAVPGLGGEPLRLLPVSLRQRLERSPFHFQDFLSRNRVAEFAHGGVVHTRPCRQQESAVG